jgi:putative transposase
MATGASEAETFWTDLLRSLARRGLRGVKLVIADAHEGLNAAVRRMLHATPQRCRVRFMRKALAHAGKGHRRLVSAWIGTAHTEGAKRQWRTVADQRRPRVPKHAALIDPAEEDVLTFTAFATEHRAKFHSTNPLERANCKIKRRTDVIRNFPSKAAVTHRVGATRLEQNDEWAVQRRYMSRETLAPISDAPNVSLPAVAR